MSSKKNRFRGLFSGEKGQRTFNYAYSIGASIVILGALFKLLHLPGADFMLILGMGTEATIFFLSAFDEPAKDYKWENVFPTLADSEAEPLPTPDVSYLGRGSGATVVGSGVPAGGTIIIGDIGAQSVGGTQPAHGDADINVSAATPTGVPTGAATVGSTGLSATDTAALTEATQNYVRQLNAASEGLARLQEFTSTLSGSEQASFADQMQSLGRNIQGLNTIYEIQLKSVSAQLDTIERVNSGLNQIRSLYENGTNDSYRIRQETERMTQTLAQLNQVYERMLQAMTVNVGMQPLSQQPTYAQPPYTPQPQAAAPQTAYQQPSRGQHN